ncbi:DMT family transporter [Stakelama saccharophila]|uniref:DMT family transporter n=1 Tax=Stakelama saccharophila TaxID=3075605 RepID=A0ABZ0BE44_9SPHN|nr:DMT family transporter [Stakelama sp. W311]WNO54624.1 DMT family transporter [Stakelama sp. W311]
MFAVSPDVARPGLIGQGGGMSRAASPAIAFAVGVLGIATFSMMDAAMKGLGLTIGTYNALFWRGIVIVALGAAVHFARRPTAPSREAMVLHLRRGMVALVMSFLFFWGLARVPMAQAISLSYIAPLLAIFLAALLLGEKVGRASIAGSLAALTGIGIILFGQSRADLGDAAFLGSVAILGSAICYSYNLILARQQALRAGPTEIAFWQSLFVLTGLALAAPWAAVLPPADAWPKIVIAAVLGMISLMLLAWAYARGEASYLAPTEYSSFVWAALFGHVFFGERVTGYTLAGATMIVAGCLYAARRRPRPFVDAETQLP